MDRVEMIRDSIKNKKEVRYCEVGVLRGKFSALVLKNNNISEAHLIDSWTVQPKEIYNDYPKKDLIRWDETFSYVKKKFKEDKRVILKRNFSVEASRDYKDNFFDIVYIDANHSYKTVLEDLKAWYPKVKEGGIISGHDADMKSVRKAVDEFFKGKCKFTTEGKATSFYYVK